MRMPANELFVQPARDLVRVERSLLARELRVQGDLQEKIEELDRVSGGVTRAQKLPVDGTIERDGDGAQRRKRVPIEAARRNDIEAGGPALQDGSQRRRATRTRGQG